MALRPALVEKGEEFSLEATVNETIGNASSVINERINFRISSSLARQGAVRLALLPGSALEDRTFMECRLAPRGIHSADSSSYLLSLQP